MSVRIRQNGVRAVSDIHVPQWTAEKTPGKGDHTNDALLDIPPRIALRPLERETPLHLQGVSRFLASGHPSRCRYAANSMLGRYLSVAAALREGGRFLRNLADMLDEYFGPRGSNRTMRALHAAISKCWDLNSIVHQRPTKEVLEALLVAYRCLRPRLDSTFWPDPRRFPHVEHSWPTENQLLVQFLMLRRRVLARLERPPAQRQFLKLSSALVRLEPPPSSTVFRALWPLLRFRPPQLRPGARRTGRMRPLVLIDSFLGTRLGSLKEGLLKVGADELYVPGPMFGRGAARRARPCFAYPGQVLGLLTFGLEGKLVRVLAVTQKVDVRRLAASFDTDPAWHQPSLAPLTHGVKHCYHMIFLAHRFRLLLPPETCVETWGSQLHKLYDDQTNLPAARHAARLYLKESKVQCVGGARDEAIVTAIAEHLIDVGGKKPHLRRGGAASSQSNVLKLLQRDESAWGLAGGVALRLGRDEEHLLRTQPTQLDPALRRHLEARVERDVYGKSKRDGSGVKLLRAPAIAKPMLSDVTRSVFRERLAAWLSTDDAADWRRQRDALQMPDEESNNMTPQPALACLTRNFGWLTKKGGGGSFFVAVRFGSPFVVVAPCRPVAVVLWSWVWFGAC